MLVPNSASCAVALCSTVVVFESSAGALRDSSDKLKRDTSREMASEFCAGVAFDTSEGVAFGTSACALPDPSTGGDLTGTSGKSPAMTAGSTERLGALLWCREDKASGTVEGARGFPFPTAMPTSALPCGGFCADFRLNRSVLLDCVHVSQCRR